MQFATLRMEKNDSSSNRSPVKSCTNSEEWYNSPNFSLCIPNPIACTPNPNKSTFSVHKP